MQPGAPTVPAAITCSICHSSFTDKQLLKLHLKQQGHYATPKIDQADVHKQQVVRHYDTSKIDQADVQAPHAHGKQKLVLAHDKKAAALISAPGGSCHAAGSLGTTPRAQSVHRSTISRTHSTYIAVSDQSCFTGQATQAHCFLQEPATQRTSPLFQGCGFRHD
jgi:hypothetical protein